MTSARQPVADKLIRYCRRRPFLIKSLENTLSKLLKSLDFYDNAARHKVAIGTNKRVAVLHFVNRISSWPVSHSDSVAVHLVDNNLLTTVWFCLSIPLLCCSYC